MVPYKFNNGVGAVICRECRRIIDEDLSPAEAELKWKDKDLCPRCARVVELTEENDKLKATIAKLKRDSFSKHYGTDAKGFTAIGRGEYYDIVIKELCSDDKEDAMEEAIECISNLKADDFDSIEIIEGK